VSHYFQRCRLTAIQTPEEGPRWIECRTSTAAIMGFATCMRVGPSKPSESGSIPRGGRPRVEMTTGAGDDKDARLIILLERLAQRGRGCSIDRVARLRPRDV
jgi:hypothetical protein